MSTIQTVNASADILRALLWQHNHAARLESLLQAKQAWYDENQQGFWSDWVRDVFDLRTANDFGLTVWAIILGLPLGAELPPNNGPRWAFGSAGSRRRNFGRGNFGSLSNTLAGLTTEQKRLALRLRYFQLVSRCTVPEINRYLAQVFEDVGSVYVLDAGNMEFATFVFSFVPSSPLEFILRNFDLLPRPAGVGLRFIVSAEGVWGFGPDNENFDNGNFYEF